MCPCTVPKSACGKRRLQVPLLDAQVLERRLQPTNESGTSQPLSSERNHNPFFKYLSRWVISSLPMDAQFRTVFAGVRPPRLAVLVDQGDSDWQDTCRRLIECLASTWGGEYSVIVPTDGEHIDGIFWDILEAFDPDYVCQYGKTFLDWKIGSPERYDELLQTTLRNEYPDQPPPTGARERLDQALCSGLSQTPSVSLELSRDIRMRLAPCFYEDHVIEWTFTAHAEPRYPLTPLSLILPHTQRPDRLVLSSGDIDGIPALWVESILGGSYPKQTERFESRGIHVDNVTLGVEDVYSLVTAQLGIGAETPPDYVANGPFHFSMLALSKYVLRGERSGLSPAVVVVGSTLKDFALYFGLSRMRPYVCWLPPGWLDTLAAATLRAQSGGDSVQRSERHANRLAEALLSGLRRRIFERVEFVSASLGGADLANAIDALSAASSSASFGVNSHARASADLRGLLTHPRVVYNTDNFAIPTTQQVVEGKAAGFFPTPKPKGFDTIVPYDHRWVTELRVDGIAYPRHQALGGWLIRHPLLTTKEARSGKHGLCYDCPSPMYFGGDVDTILVRPELWVPEAEAVFGRLADSAGLSCGLSDKGFFSRDIVQKMGGLEHAAALVREPRNFAVLRAYLPGARDDTAPGKYLAAETRRYLSLADVTTILGSVTEAVSLLDLLVGRGIVRRGTILKCQYCRTAEWLSMVDMADEFKCGRCARRQAIQSRHTLGHSEPGWYYQLDEIAYLGILNDSQVPLLALDYLRRQNTSFSYADELSFWRSDQPRPFIEIDLCCICDGTLTIGEAKTTERIEGGGKRERRSVAKYREAAVLLGARQFVLATSKTWSAETLANAEAAFVGTNVRVVHLEGAEILSAR